MQALLSRLVHQSPGSKSFSIGMLCFARGICVGESLGLFSFWTSPLPLHRCFGTSGGGFVPLVRAIDVPYPLHKTSATIQKFDFVIIPGIMFS